MRPLAPIPGNAPLTEPEVGRPDAGSHPGCPRLLIDAKGSITGMSSEARKLLRYTATNKFDTCFFAHIHARSLLPVMRDIASMVCRDRTSAQWIARMRTADRSWIWVRMTARKTASGSSSAASIAVDLERVSA